jgi:hypothetical protein
VVANKKSRNGQAKAGYMKQHNGDLDTLFGDTEDAYRVVLCHLNGPKADNFREEATTLFSTVKKSLEDSVEEHLTAWAQCDLIPMFTSRNNKGFSACNYCPDFLWMLPNLAVMLECDQYAHESYNRESETQRMQTL